MRWESKRKERDACCDSTFSKGPSRIPLKTKIGLQKMLLKEHSNSKLKTNAATYNKKENKDNKDTKDNKNNDKGLAPT